MVRVHRRVLLLIGRVLLLGMRSSLLLLLCRFFRECVLMDMAQLVAFRGVYRQDDREFSISGALSSILSSFTVWRLALWSLLIAWLSYSLQADVDLERRPFAV